MNGRRVRAVVGVLVLVALGSYLFWPSPRGTMGEESSAEEEYLTSQIVASALQMVDKSRQHMVSHPLPGYPPKAATGGNAASSNSQPYMRDVHSKTHGLVKATFTVLDNLDPRVRYGIFANPTPKDHPYQAWIRFSSGNEYPQPDSTDDARGFALKLMGVPGKKLLQDDGAPPAQTQDFVMMNAEQFFIRNIEEYNEFTKYLGSGFGFRARYGYFLGGPSLHVSKWHLREMMLAKGTLKKAPRSLLNTEFYSVSAFKLGSQENVKYSVRPCTEERAARVDRSKPNFLREEMQKRLASGSACFDFMVQLQVPGKNMPVEDTTVKWSEKDSPFIPVGRIDIPKQEFEANNDLAENMSFNPWHSLPEHKPIGVMNRIRKAVYLGVSRYRRDMNGVALCEPLDWDHPVDPASCEPVSPPATRTQSAEVIVKPAAIKK
jgi:catalase